MAAERGLRVKLVERTHVAQGASVRNFGMVWPIGQPAGELYALALRSRERWRSLGASGVVEIEECGSIHAAHHADEWAVLEEFRDLGEHEVSLLSAQATLAKNPLINSHGLQGGMYSPSELRVNPRVASARLAAWLKESLRVDVSFDTQAIAVEDKTVCASDGRRWTAPRIVICSGHDLQTLFPNVLLQSGPSLVQIADAQSSPSTWHEGLAAYCERIDVAALSLVRGLSKFGAGAAAGDERLTRIGSVRYPCHGLDFQPRGYLVGRLA